MTTRDQHVLRVVQDRIRAIANGLGLQTILWGFDSLDWESGVGDFGPADVDGNYWLLINNLTAGNFNRVGAIILTHELKNATMEKAIEWYPRLKSYFSVRCLFLPHTPILPLRISEISADIYVCQHIVPVGVALNKTYPYKEGNYSIPTFQQCTFIAHLIFSQENSFVNPFSRRQISKAR